MGSSNYRTTRPQDYRTTRLQDYRTTRPQDYQTILSFHQLTASFLTALRAQGHAVGVGDLQRVQELLHRLPEDATEEMLRDSLVALFAHSHGEQERCRQLFAQAQREAAAMAAAMAAVDTPVKDAIQQEDQRDRRNLLWQLGLVLLFPLFFLLAWIITPDTVTVTLAERQLLLVNGTETILPETDSLPEIGQVTSYEMPAIGTDEAPVFGRLDTVGGPLFFEATHEGVDSFVVRLIGTEHRIAVIPYRVTIQADTTQVARPPVPSPDQEAEQVQLRPLPLPHPRSLADMAPPVIEETGFAKTFHDWWISLVLLACAGLLAALFLLLRYWERRKIRLVAQREQADSAPHFWRIDLPQLRAGIDWGEGYPGLVRQLRRRREDDHQEIDLPQTIKATVNSGGLPSFRYRSATRPAEYLLLIDRGTADNHQARLFEELYQQLLAEEVLIDRYFYNGDPRLLYQHDRGQTVRLIQLQRRNPEARLFLVGSGDRLLNAASGKLAKWVPEQLGGWKTKSLLSTLPTNEWGRRERQLDTFLTVLPASMQGLQLLVQRLNDGDVDEGKIDYRALVSDAARETVVLRADQSFIESLQEVYSDSKLKWLAACALYPALHWDLTLFLGKTVGEYLQKSLLSSTNLLSLSRLPWFANGAMPEPARQELANWLQTEHPALHDHLRQAILGLLDQAELPPVGSAARRDLEFYRLQNEWLLTAPGTPERARLAEDLAQRIANGEEPDTTVVRVMEQPGKNDLTLPASWNERLYPGGFPGFGLKGLWRKMAWGGGAIFLLGIAALFLRPKAPVLNNGCPSDREVWQMLDTVNYAQDTLATIQFCDKLDSLIMAEYIWQDRVKRVADIEALDTVLLSFQFTPMIDAAGKTNMIFTPAQTLSTLLESSPKDSLEETHRQNIGTMIFNRGFAFRDSLGNFSSVACDFFIAGGQFLDGPEAYYPLLAEICSPAEQEDPEEEVPPAQDVEQGEETETFPADPAAMQYGRTAIRELEDLKNRLEKRFPNRGVLVRPVLTRIENRITTLRKKMDDGTLTMDDFSDYNSLRDQGELLLMGGEEPPEQGPPETEQGQPQTPPQSTPTAPAAAPEQVIASNVPYPAMVSIPAATFEMGDTFGEGFDEELPVHTVTLSAYSLGKDEVTFADFDLFCAETGFKQPNDRGWGRARRPVIYVSWYDAVAYCNWLSKQHGYTPVYAIAGDDARQQQWTAVDYGQDLNDDEPNITADWSADGYRLPTEAEWEYAASYRKDGTKARFGNGQDTLRPTEANFDAREGNEESYSEVGEYRGRTVPVGTFPANALDLRNMAGNVWEWCWDGFGADYYGKSSANNPKGADAGTNRVIRGGSWYYYPSFCRAAIRNYFEPTYRGSNVGFRLARSSRGRVFGARGSGPRDAGRRPA